MCVVPPSKLSWPSSPSPCLGGASVPHASQLLRLLELKSVQAGHDHGSGNCRQPDTQATRTREAEGKGEHTSS